MERSTFQQIFYNINSVNPEDKDIRAWRYIFESLKDELEKYVVDEENRTLSRYSIDFFDIDGFEFLQDLFYIKDHNIFQRDISPRLTRVLIEIFGEEIVWGDRGGFACWHNREVLTGFSDMEIDEEACEDQEFIEKSWKKYIDRRFGL